MQLLFLMFLFLLNVLTSFESPFLRFPHHFHDDVTATVTAGSFYLLARRPLSCFIPLSARASRLQINLRVWARDLNPFLRYSQYPLNSWQLVRKVQCQRISVCVCGRKSCDNLSWWWLVRVAMWRTQLMVARFCCAHLVTLKKRRLGGFRSRGAWPSLPACSLSLSRSLTWTKDCACCLNQHNKRGRGRRRGSRRSMCQAQYFRGKAFPPISPRGLTVNHPPSLLQQPPVTETPPAPTECTGDSSTNKSNNPPHKVPLYLYTPHMHVILSVWKTLSQMFGQTNYFFGIIVKLSKL